MPQCIFAASALCAANQLLSFKHLTKAQIATVVSPIVLIPENRVAG